MSNRSAFLIHLLRECWRDLILSPLSRRRQRRALQHLDDHLLRDIGITRREARLEAQQSASDLTIDDQAKPYSTCRPTERQMRL